MKLGFMYCSYCRLKAFFSKVILTVQSDMYCSGFCLENKINLKKFSLEHTELMIWLSGLMALLILSTYSVRNIHSTNIKNLSKNKAIHSPLNFVIIFTEGFFKKRTNCLPLGFQLVPLGL